MANIGRQVVSALLALAVLQPAAAAPVGDPAGRLGTAVQDLGGGWRFRTGDDPSYAQPDLADEAWQTVNAGRSWRSFPGHERFYGFAWYRRHFEVAPSVLARARIQLDLKLSEESVWTYLNGRLLAATPRGSHAIDIPRDALKPQDNVMAFRFLCYGEEVILGVPGYQGCGLTGSVRLVGSETDRKGTPMRVTTNRPGNITEPDVPISVRASVINTTDASRTYTAIFDIDQRYGSGRSRQEITGMLESGEARDLTVAFTSLVRGPYDVTVILKDQQGQIATDSLVLGVADAPAPPDDRFGVNLLNGEDVMASIGADGVGYFELARRAGAAWVREQSLPWRHVQQEPGIWNWTMFDRVRNAADSAGIEVLWTGIRTPYWAIGHPVPTVASELLTGAGQPPLPKYNDEFAAFLERAAARWSGMHWEIGNEPDLYFLQPLWWNAQSGIRSDRTYLEMLRPAAARIREADPTATIVLAGQAEPEGDITTRAHGSSFLDRFLQSGGGSWFDIMNFHGYTNEQGDERAGLTKRMEETRAIMARYGIEERPVWVTETNEAPAAAESSRAAAARNVVELLAAGAAKVFFFNGIDYPGEPLPGVGMFDVSGSPTAAFFSFLTMTRMLAGRDVIDPVVVAGTPGYRFSSSGGTQPPIVMLWDAGGRTISIPAGASAYDDFGNPITGKSLRLAPTVHYLVGP